MLVPSSSNQSLAIKPLKITSHLAVEPRFFYYANNQFVATVNGELRLNIKTKSIKEKLVHYNAIVIEDYHSKLSTHASLNWKINDTRYQISINKTKDSVNPLDFHTQDFSEIEDLHLLIETYPEVGHNLEFQDTVTFRSIYFDRLESQNSFAVNLSEWTDFTPVKFNSINGYTSSQDLHLKGLILRLTLWLLITIILFFITQVKGKNLTVMIIIAWLIPTSIFMNNHLKQHNQLSTSFSTDQTSINPLDQLALEVSHSIQNYFDANQQYVAADNKLVLLGFNNFFNLRLIRHLLKYNIGINNGIQRMLDHDTKIQPTYILVQKYLRYCQQPEKFPWLSEQVDYLYVDDQFCLMKKK